MPSLVLLASHVGLDSAPSSGVTDVTALLNAVMAVMRQDAYVSKIYKGGRGWEGGRGEGREGGLGNKIGNFK